MENWTAQTVTLRKLLTVWLLEVHDRVVVLEHIDFFDVGQRLHTYTLKAKSCRFEYVPNFLMADLILPSSCTVSLVTTFWVRRWVPTFNVRKAVVLPFPPS